MTPHYDADTDEYVLTTEIGEFFGDTPDQCERRYNEALRVASDHARHNAEYTLREAA